MILFSGCSNVEAKLLELPDRVLYKSESFNSRMIKLEKLLGSSRPCEAISGTMVEPCLTESIDWIIKELEKELEDE